MTLTEIVPRFVRFSLTNSTQNRKAMRRKLSVLRIFWGVVKSNEKPCVCNVFATFHSLNSVKSRVCSYQNVNYTFRRETTKCIQNLRNLVFLGFFYIPEKSWVDVKCCESYSVCNISHLKLSKNRVKSTIFGCQRDNYSSRCCWYYWQENKSPVEGRILEKYFELITSE